MSTVYMSQLSAALPLMEGDHHHHRHQGHFQAAFSMPKDAPILFPFVISSSSSSPSDTTLSYGSDHHLRQQQHQAQLLEPQHMIGGSSSAGIFATPFPTVESIRDDMIERSPFDPYDTEKLLLQGSCGSANKVAAGSSKWSAAPAAKMRITRKTSDVVPSVTGGAAAAAPVKKPRRRAQAYEDHGHGAGAVGTMGQGLGVIRVCSDCNTTKTPLWRSGPCGPKSLCNACGIRQRKAQRAMMASGSPASAVAGAKDAATPTYAAAAQPKVKKEKRADVDRTLPFKKRCKVVQVQDQTTAPPATNAAAMEETAESAAAAPPTTGPLVDSICSLSWTTNFPSVAATTTSSFSFRPSPAAAAVHDEITDAAMLLMTLSCGLVRS
ncbi:hypothetical protein GUJ93_ZPchr0006g41282 [Zizania palustris]|uniref:GATA-type domain-containing protein n=1 Tax=Zizania palustris TaxID=103762 RepID=A0A8J5VKZ4_ZIZPA|nr:hypothetical protein GUJ93_ZPchr0006g41282 [Zizania palustris]